MMINCFVFVYKERNKMFFRNSNFFKTFICVLVVLLCLLMTGCLKVESHREFPEASSEQTTDPSAPGVDNRPRVALTYDDGPHEKYQDTLSRTKLIVDELDKYGYHATFFVVGNRVDGTEYNGGDAMVYAANHGNEIGIHGYTHNANYATCSDEIFAYEMDETLKAIQSKLPGYEVRVMRPVGGEISNERVATTPFAVVNWSVDTLDWTLTRPIGDAASIEEIVNNALKNIKDGDIVLMHDIHYNTYEATVIILQRLNEMGFNVVTVSELLGEDLEPGRLYTQK
jgi:peptidoglycan/xylan/chitin deacetylase (PgdA/CDA1 family)